MLGLPYTPETIATLAGAQLAQVGAYADQPVLRVEYDTRQILQPEGVLFVALKTGQRNGHSFVHLAYELGVRVFWVSEAVDLPDDCTVLRSENPLEGLQAWAAHHRGQLAYPIWGITGSNGKTIVKEWLATLLEGSLRVGKSPRSFNSQLGVPLSILALTPGLDVGIIEAGISQAGEMERLAAVIRPDMGIFTRFGDAHDEGFASRGAKLAEKCKLFEPVTPVITLAGQPEVVSALTELDCIALTIGMQETANFRVSELNGDETGWRFRLTFTNGETCTYSLPQPGQAALENAWLAIAAACLLGLSPETIAERLPRLRPVALRMEVLSDNPEITILNDSYNADLTSVNDAFARFLALEPERKHLLVITDLEHQGEQLEALQRQLLQRAVQLVGAAQVRAVGPVSCQLAAAFPGLLAYNDTEQLLEAFWYEDWRNSVVLLKGARRWALERMLPLLTRRAHTTYLRVDLNALVHNFRVLRAQVGREVRLCAMVKASAYGSGSWQVAAELAREGVDYIAVAYADEGILLREHGIQTPILVLNADESTAEALLQYRLEPGVWSLRQLQAFAKLGQPLAIHLEFDTGMARLGLHPGEVSQLLALLAQYPQLKPVTAYTHLAASEDPAEDMFTHTQLEAFASVIQELKRHYPAIWAHSHNTGGILRFPRLSLDMVRLGIGLYGVSPVPEFSALLQPVGSLLSTISQIHHYAAGTSVGYGRSQMLTRDSRIGTLPIGYADGIYRKLGNGRAQFGVRGRLCPTVGRICMDMCMIDLTDLPEAQEGDEVLLFGKHNGQTLPVEDLARQAETIAYELLTHIGPRVRRVYVRE